MNSFWAISLGKKFKSQTVIGEKLRKGLLYKKVASKMLMKLTLGFCINNDGQTQL